MDRFRNTRQPDWDWWGRLWPTPGETLRRLGLRSGHSVVEAGCGNGYFALPAARIVDPATVYALDLDESLLEELVQLAGLHELAGIEPLHGDARKLGRLLPEPVDVVLIANTFHGVEDRGGFAEQAYDSLREGGRFIVVNWRDLPHESTTIDGAPRGPPMELRMTPEETEAAVLETTAFTLGRRVDLPPYHYGLLFDR